MTAAIEPMQLQFIGGPMDGHEQDVAEPVDIMKLLGIKLSDYKYAFQPSLKKDWVGIGGTFTLGSIHVYALDVEFARYRYCGVAA